MKPWEAMSESEKKALAAELPGSAEQIVDGVLRLCEAMDKDDWSINQLMKLFNVALCGGRRLASVKLTMISYALDKLGDNPVSPKRGKDGKR